VNGLRHGYGTLQYPDGGKYEGNWFNGKQHGKGSLQFADKKEFSGQWSNGVYIGSNVATD
jgi:hypothetical protein